MDKNDVLNRMIPADDLHWVPDEGFVLLSIEEIDDIIRVGRDQDMTEDDIFKMVRWCESVRAGQVLCKNVMSGGIRIHHFDNNEPVFVRNEDHNNV